MSGLRLILAGAAIGNGNRGVEALGQSVIDSVDDAAPGSVLTILDDGWGVRDASDQRHARLHLEYAGVRRSRRWHRPESWARIVLAQRLGLPNPVAARFAAADAVLDLSAGDSFTDLYGAARLAAVSAPKEAAIRAGSPLVLLPQTYGPFESAAGRRRAERLVRSAALAWARDPHSYNLLLELAGPDADRSRLRPGVDVAFALQPRRPSVDVAERIEALAVEVTAGVNASGLLCDPAGHARFSLSGDYVETMTEVVRRLLATGAHVVLVPHVHVAGGRGESDIVALERIRERLDPHEQSRTITLPPHLDAAELKWCISRLDWFVGSRMHSTIAALSTLTPAAAYAYSDKTLGVFQTCGVGDHVIDARRTHGDEAAAAILSSFESRAAVQVHLQTSAPTTIEASREQLRDILDLAREWRAGTSTAERIA